MLDPVNKMYKHAITMTVVCVVFCIGLTSAIAQAAESKEQTLRPNILLIVADDMGYTDAGAFGGEIKTPNIDALAKSGMRMTNFYAAPTCSPTRAMLMSGTDNHIAGLGVMFEYRQSQHEGVSGYEGYLNKKVVSLATLLKDAGYHTYMAGKWHLGFKPGYRPFERGFEKSFALMNGGASHFSDMAMITSAAPKASYYDDATKLKQLPDNFYSSEFYTNRIIENIDSNIADGKPFFAWLAYTAPHWPLQVPDDYADLYKGKYDEGYDALRERRVASAKKTGLFNTSVEVTPRLPFIPGWDSLSEEEKKFSARSMELYAAMVERMDFHFGRLISHLKTIGEYENTFIIFMSDNGAEGKDPHVIRDNKTWIPENFDLSYDNMGKPNSYVYYNAGWAQSGTAPFYLYKAFTSEGGIRVPFIVSYEKLIDAGSTTDVVATVRDIAPTLLDLAGAEHPGTSYDGRTIYPITGKSMLSFLNKHSESIYSNEDAIGWELFGHRAIRQGDWKLLWISGDYGSDRWQLYNLVDDPAERRDLSIREPKKLKHMLALWEDYVKRVNVMGSSS